MPSSNVEAIKEKLDVVEFLKGYLQVQPAGKNFKAVCPFHSEKTPSFMISPDRQTWHCFGCNTGGDIFTFLMRYENLEFGEALRVLAEKAGIELKATGSGDYRFTNLLYDINRAAADFFVKELPRSNPAREYLLKRKLAEGTIHEFELGWAPQSEDALGLHLLQKGFYPDDVLRAGLVIKSDRGLPFDRFRGRIMFPIHNNFGKVVGFTGRVLPQFDDGKMGKYVNSPESPIFAKSKLLYGLWKTKNQIRDMKSAFLVEGQMDFLMSYQAGVKNVVASSGTALTNDHLRGLKRLADELTVSFDTDEAGLTAGERAIDLAETNDFNVKVVMLSGFKDPAEAIENNPEAFHKALTEAKPAIQFYFERHLPKKMIRSVPSRDELRGIRAVLLKIKNVASAVTRSFWIKELSKRTGVDERVLLEEADRIQPAAEKYNATSEAASETEPQLPSFSRRELVSQYLLAAAYTQGNFEALKGSIAYLPPTYQELFEILKAGNVRVSGNASLDALMNIVLLRGNDLATMNVQELAQRLFEEYTKDERQAIAYRVKEAEREGDDAALAAALYDLSNLREKSQGDAQ